MENVQQTESVRLFKRSNTLVPVVTACLKDNKYYHLLEVVFFYYVGPKTLKL